MARIFTELQRMHVQTLYKVCLLIFAVLLQVSCASDETIEISNQVTKEQYCLETLRTGDVLSFEWEHSFEHVLWKEFYRVTDDHSFKLFTIAVQGFGAGIPAEMDCTYRYEDGLIYKASQMDCVVGYLLSFGLCIRLYSAGDITSPFHPRRYDFIYDLCNLSCL